MTIFLRMLEADDKASALRSAVKSNVDLSISQRYEVDTASFAAIPGSPFTYWVSARLRGLFSEYKPFESNGRVARQGGVNGDDFRWLRLWTEIDRVTKRGG